MKEFLAAGTDEDLRSDINRRSLLVKAEGWQYEKEWRLIRTAQQGPAQFPEDMLSAVILGAETSERDQQLICGLITRRSHPIRVMMATASETEYAMEFVEVSSETVAELAARSSTVP